MKLQKFTLKIFFPIATLLLTTNLLSSTFYTCLVNLVCVVCIITLINVLELQETIPQQESWNLIRVILIPCEDGQKKSKELLPGTTTVTWRNWTRKKNMDMDVPWKTRKALEGLVVCGGSWKEQVYGARDGTCAGWQELPHVKDINPSQEETWGGETEKKEKKKEVTEDPHFPAEQLRENRK